MVKSRTMSKRINLEKVFQTKGIYAATRLFIDSKDSIKFKNLVAAYKITQNYSFCQRIS